MGEKEDCQIFPLVIARFKDEPDPMMIVSDSYGTYEDKESGLIYHITGIGVLDDGQYFCKIYHEPWLPEFEIGFKTIYIKSFLW